MPQRLFELVPGVMVQTSNMWQMNSLVISGTDATVVVDPGWFPDEIAGLQTIATASPVGRPTHVLITHADFDHIVGWADFPGAQLIAHPRAAGRDPADSQRQVENLDSQNYVARPQAYRYPSAAAFSSPDSLDLGGETALFFASPGHVADALFTVLPERRVLVAGDYLSDLEFPFVNHSFREYRATLDLARRLCSAHAIDYLVPGHGQVARSRAEITYRIDTDSEYLDGLRAAVGKLMSAGVTLAEAIEQLRGFVFRGQPIAASLASSHAGNVKFLYEHPDEAGGDRE